MDMQGLIDRMAKEDQRVRAQYHLTLGELIKFLELHSGKGDLVWFDFRENTAPGQLTSYRGYYCDLAFVYQDYPHACAVGTFLKQCREALGKTFTGYKGGDFVMDEDTPLWVVESDSDYPGRAIVGVGLCNDNVVLDTRRVDL